MSEDKMNPERTIPTGSSRIDQARREVWKSFDEMLEAKNRFSGLPKDNSQKNGDFDKRIGEFEDKVVLELEEDVIAYKNPDSRPNIPTNGKPQLKPQGSKA